MENEEIITVENKGGKGNPNHEPPGTSKGGQFASAPSIGNKFLDFLKAKTTTATTQTEEVAPVSSYSFQDVVKKNLVANLSVKNLENSFNAGTSKAQQVVYDFFRDTQTRIDKGEGKYLPLFHKILLSNGDLSGDGKHGGFYELGEVLYHEIMHAIDHRYGEITTTRILSNGKTIKQTFHDEINSNKYSWNWNLYNEVKADYDKAIEEEMNKMFTPDQIKEYKDKAEYYRKYLNDLNKNFDNHYYNYPSIQAYNEAFDKYKQDFKNAKKEWKKYNDIFLPARQKATQKFSCLSDFCSYIYRTGTGRQSICGGHTKAYWSMDNGNKPIKEMWAELGSMWARGKTDDIERMRKYFPDTVSSFEELVGSLDKIRKEKYGE